jgi:hypothetical protein
VRSGTRRALLAWLGALGVVSSIGQPPSVAAHHYHHKRHHKQCNKHCKANRKTCDRGCDILDDDSQQFCKQSCRVALSQCKANC